MTTRISFIVFLVLNLDLRGQTSSYQSIDGLTIDPTIKKEVEQYISNSDFSGGQDKLLIYNNRMFADFYESDTLRVTTNDKEISRVFKSFYYWTGDTLRIDGAFGLFGGSGFTVKIAKGKATQYHMLASDESPAYSYNENDSLIFRLEVPCTRTKIILSEVPNSTQNQVVYGYVEFNSGQYYASEGSVNGEEFKPRKKSRANMRIYFKTGRSPFYQAR